MVSHSLPAPDPDPLLALRELVARIEEGSVAAESELVAHYSPGLRVILRRLTPNAALADDLHQETLAVVLRKIRARELRQPESLAGFVRATAKNLFIADRRKEARYADLGEEPEAEMDRLKHAGEPSGHPLHRLVAEEEARLVRQLLDELRHQRDRELLVRVYLHEEDKESVCRELEIDPALYNRVLFRARQRLRELWERNEKRQLFFAAAEELQKARDDNSRGGTLR